MNPLPISAADDDPNVPRVLWSALLLTLVGDLLFWSAQPGISLGLFALLTALALLGNRDRSAWTRGGVITAGLLIPSAAQSGIESSWSNVLVLATLLVVLVGETSYPAIPSGWPRWSEAVFAFVKAPARWGWFAGVAKRMRLRGGPAGVLTQVVLPALLLGGVFVILFSSGNAIFADWVGKGFELFREWVPALEFPFERVLLLAGLATFSLALLRPGMAPVQPRPWTRELPTFSAPVDLVIAHWRSLAILGLANVLFFAANMIDVFYLWTNGKIPQGISHSDYVHQGVNSLIAAVLLAAAVIIVLFQQDPEVTRSKAMKALSLAWIAQNGALIASVVLRLKLYVDAYQLTEQRVFVALFLLLVVTGFLMLSWYILRPGSLLHLLLSNVIATFVLFFGLQFCDVDRWVADYNVWRWEHDPNRSIDLAYIETLGPSGWPALMPVAATLERPESRTAIGKVQQLRTTQRTKFESANWRSWQWRTWEHARQLLGHDVRPQGF
jgi:hypothetical protein